jgi:hypothetical protein
MCQNFGSKNNISLIEKLITASETTRYFHNMETMGAIRHALSCCPLSSSAHSYAIDPFPTASPMLGTLVFNVLIGGVPKVADSRRVLATAVEDWSENILALAPVRVYA